MSRFWRFLVYVLHLKNHPKVLCLGGLQMILFALK